MKWKLALPVMAGILMWTTVVPAQTFTVLHTFGAGTDGSQPVNVVLMGNTLYGTTYAGGTNKSGTVFSVNTDGTGYTVLHSFAAAAANASGDTTNADGSNPEGPLTVGGNTLYGTAVGGGTNGWGAIYALATNGANFSVLYTFPGFSGRPATNMTGNNPAAGLLLTGGTLYGLNSNGGTNKVGTLFSIGTNGSGYTVLFNFDKVTLNTNVDGSNPANTLIQSGDTFYAPAGYGGMGRGGTVFSFDPSDSVFTVLHTFTNYPDGGNPFGPVTASGGMLYGNAATGGSNDWGCVYALPTAGGAIAQLHGFTPASALPFTNADGTYPHGELALANGWLYGTANAGGAYASGDVFYVSISTGNFGVLHPFSTLNTNLAGVQTNWDGANPNAGVLVNGNTLYGVAQNGGTNGDGVVFSLTLPALAVSGFNLTGSNLVIHAGNGLGGATCTVLTASNLALPLSQWLPVGSLTLTNTGNFTVTATNAVNAGSGQQFYILQEQ